MLRRLVLERRRYHFHTTVRRLSTRNIIEINGATFHRAYPSPNDTSESNPALFPGLRFHLPSESGDGIDPGGVTGRSPEYWSVISPSSSARTTFLQILSGQHICTPPTARRYPHLSTLSLSPQHAIKYVGFDADRGSNVGGTNVRGAYLSARYESRREETDFSVYDYLNGNTELNALERDEAEIDRDALDEVIQQLNLSSLLRMPVANLSNGQTRRARIAKALISRPEVLLLDGPFMGLDPNTLATMSTVLMKLAHRQQPRLIMSLRPEDGVPEWITHLVVVDENLNVLTQGSKADVAEGRYHTSGSGLRAKSILQQAGAIRNAAPSQSMESVEKLSRDGHPAVSPPLSAGEGLVEMHGVKVAYGDKTVLGDWNQSVDGQERQGLWWSLHRGQRAGIFGANGSGKTTMLSLITSDHPQTYSLPIKLFGRSRLPEAGQPGISIFDIQKRMGHSSPEVHAFFPKQLSVRRAIESAWADAPLSRPQLTAEAKRRVDACLRWFAKELGPTNEPTALEKLRSTAIDDGLECARRLHSELLSHDIDLEWARTRTFRELSFSNQRLVLFLRAIVSSPDLVILDEALSGIDETTRDKALLFLSHGEMISRITEPGVAEPSVVTQVGGAVMKGLAPAQALLVISHAKEDVPGCIREWICLPEPGEGNRPRVGVLEGPLELNPQGWDQIWGRQ